MLHLVGGSRGFVDKAADGLRVGCAQARASLNFIVPIKPLIALGDEMFPAERATVERRGDVPATIGNTTNLSFRHLATQQTWDRGFYLYFG
jgi:hypothetical protein